MERVFYMKMLDKRDFLEKSKDAIAEIYDIFTNAEIVGLKDLKAENTAFVIVDMVNGFAREGALKSPRVEALIPEIVKISKACGEHGIIKIAFADCHKSYSPEFGSYPPHCLKDTSESEIVNELKEAGGYQLIEKNSTNGFIEEQFQDWLVKNPKIDTFILAGDCTDICVEQFANTIKAFFNTRNKKSRVIVPISLVDTYDLGTHDADLMNLMALYIMRGNGIEIVKDIIL